jgi:hypothetical protein
MTEHILGKLFEHNNWANSQIPREGRRSLRGVKRQEPASSVEKQEICA